MKNKLLFSRGLALVAIVVLMMMPWKGWGQTSVFADDFNRATLSPGGTPSMTYTKTLATGVTADIVSSTYLSIINSTTAGISYVSGPVSTFSAPYNSTLSSNTGTVTWTFNFRWNRASSNNPAAPASGSYGQAIILASSSSNLSTVSTGYAVVYGNSSTPDPIRLVRFSGGVTGTLTDICSSGASDIANTNNFASVRVTYEPATNTWALFVRDDGATAWADPSSGVTTQKGSNTVNSTYTGSTLTHFGFLWSHGTSASLSGDFDNFKVTVTSPAITSTQAGPWTTGSTWVGGVAPTSGQNVVIAHAVTAGALTRDAGKTTTINTGASLAVSGTYTDNGATTVNGTYQIDAGGWATGNNLTYGATGTLTMNASAYGVNNGTYWPATSGPVNVNILQSVTMGFARSVTGTLSVSAAVTNATTNTLTVSGGTCQINNTSATFSDPLLYSGTSNLVYNVTGTIGRGNEWNNSPSNVTLQATTTLNYPNGWGAITRTLTGNLTIGTGTALYMDYGSPGTGVGALTVGGNVSLSGNLSLGNQAGGDLNVAGNWSNTGGTFTPNGRAVTFNGTGAQSITNALGATFAYLIINKASGTLTLANNVTVNAASSDVLQLLNAGSFDLNGKSLTLSGAGGNIKVTGAARTISSGVAGGTINISGAKTVTSATSGSLIISTNITTILTAGLDCGSGLSTINSTLQIDAGGFITNNAPIYGAASLLKYNSATTYGRGLEWSAIGTIGTTAGYPNDIQISNSTTLNAPNTGAGAFSTALGMARDLTIDALSNLYMDYGGSGNKSGSLSVGRNVAISGGLSLGNATGGDMNVAGNWTRTGIFTPNSRLVTFTGATPTLTGATTFDYLTLNNATGLTLQASSAVIVNQTLALSSGKLTLGANDLTIGSSGSISGQTSSKYIVTNSTGKLKRTVGASAVIFPVGNSAYNQLTFNNSGTSDVYGVQVVDGAITTGANNAKTVNRRWVTTEAVAGGSNLSVVAQYNSGEPNTGFAAATDPFIGFYNGSAWTQAAATAAGANPYTYTSNANLSPADMTTGTQYFALGKDNAFLSVATKLVITSVSPASPTAGSVFSVTVQSQDPYGVVVNVVAGTAFTLTSNGNAGSIGGTVTGTILAGTNSITVTGVTLASAGTLVTLTATRTSGDVLTAGTSSTFSVLAAADHLAFVGVPATGNVGVNLASFTVEARRPDNSVDNTYAAANIVISKASGSGNLSGTLSVPATLGVATFSAAQFDAASTYTLSANSGSLTAATSGNIVVTLAPISLGTYPFNGTACTVATRTASGVATNLTFSLASVTGETCNSNSSTSYSVGGSSWGTTFSASRYIEFSVTPAIGYYLTATSLAFDYLRTAAGATNASVRSSADTYTADLTTLTVGTSSANANISLGAPFNTLLTQITFRIYGWGGNSTGDFRVDNIALNGNVLCIQPVAYSVTGGGAYCSGGSGVAIGLSNSQVGVSYQLKVGGSNTGSPMAGTGAAISFGLQTAAGTYTVVGSNINGSCNYTLDMTGNVAITTEATPVAGILAKTPNTASVLRGTDVSAALTAGSGGNGTDELEYRYGAAGSWAAYTTGTNLSTTGQTSVEIRTRRMASVCSPSAYTTVSWSVDATTTYTGTGNWSTSGNWSYGIPSAGIDATVNGIVTIDVAAVTNNLTINTGKSVTISSTKSLTVSGTLTNSAGSSGLIVNSGGSLIQNSAVLATVKRDIAAWGTGVLANHGWHFLSSPVTAQAIDPDFTNATPANYDFFAWWEPNYEWVNFKATSGTSWSTANVLGGVGVTTDFNPGQGYLVEYLASGTKQFTGTLNHTDITLSNLSYGSSAYKGFHLLGNPFTSALTWNDGNWGAFTNVVATAKVWDDATASYLPISANGIIPALNGFMVEVTSATNSLKIPLASRVHDAAAWYKTSDGPTIVLVAKDPAGQTAQGSFVRFEKEATNGFDPSFDSHFLAGLAPQFYSVMGNEKLSTNTLPELASETIIPFSFIKNTSTNFSIEAQGIESLGTGATVYLWDNKLGTKHNLSTNPVYTFASTEGDAATRFELHFSTTYGIDETATLQPFSIYATNNTVCVANTSATSVKGEAYVYNTLGQIIAHQKLNGDLTKINIAATTGYYLVKVITEKTIFVGKVFVKQQ